MGIHESLYLEGDFPVKPGRMSLPTTRPQVVQMSSLESICSRFVPVRLRFPVPRFDRHRVATQDQADP